MSGSAPFPEGHGRKDQHDSFMNLDTPLDLLLASTSRYRRELLERLGVPFRVAAPACDEEALKTSYRPEPPPRELAERLALAKAESLRDAEPSATILGGDQVAVVEGEILSKPGTWAGACEQLERLSGRSHELITAIAVLHRGRVLQHTDVTRLTMRSLSRSQIERYVDADKPLDCAGSYIIERRGVTLFSAIESSDPSAITGMPLMALTAMLTSVGYVIP